MIDARFDMHCHIEGSAPPWLVRELAEANGVALPDGLLDDEDRYAWDGFVDFLDAYDRASACIRRGDDYARVSYEHLKLCAAEGGIYVEFFISPDHAELTGIPYAELLDGVVRGIARAEREFAIVARIVVSCVRHHGPGQALAAARLAVAEAHPWVTGFGMAGDENRFTAADFAPAFRLAHEAGLRCSAHAGEAAGADSLRAVIEALPVERIGHGVRAIEDPGAIDLVLNRDIALEVCVGSNLAIGIFADSAAHPLPRLLELGCSVVLGSDDPPYFGTSIGEEYRRITRDFGLPAAMIERINRTALERAFCDEATRARLRARLAR